MYTGRVKWFDVEKLFGFIQPDDGSPEIFLHSSNLADTAAVALQPGIPVRYSIGQKGGKVFAERVRVAAANGPSGGATRTTVRAPDDEDFADAFEKEWGLRRVPGV